MTIALGGTKCDDVSWWWIACFWRYGVLGVRDRIIQGARVAACNDAGCVGQVAWRHLQSWM